MSDPARAVVKLQYMAAEPGDGDGHPSLLEGWEYEADEPMLDGPVCRRLAVVDFDPASGAVLPGAPFRPPGKTRKLGRYFIADEGDSDSAHFRQVSVFGAVMKMIDMFEEPDVLGRKLRWAFAGEQLLVVPQAGIMQNAFYHRGSRSLQFFSFQNPKSPGAMVHTCLSPDIVAHEATHAILDGIAPDLYDATSPQALAIHEAVADIGAVMFALRSRRLTTKVLQMTGGDLNQSNAFNKIAQQFGEVVYGPGRPLRDLTNTRTMANAPSEPHDLSEVLTGALYSMLVKLHEEAITERLAAVPSTRFSASGFALSSAANRLKRLAFRGLDYLPPGDVSFADYGRAIVAADTSSNPGDHHLRDRAKEAFVAREIVASGAELDSVLPVGFLLPADLDLDLLLHSDWAAYQFCERFRAELMIPAGVSFEVRPRLDVTKLTYQGDEQTAHTHELILKVAWRERMLACLVPDLIHEVSVMRGTTLAINWDQRRICGLVSTSPRDASQMTPSSQMHDAMRIAFLKQGLESGLLEIGSPNVQVQGHTLRLKATGQMLHMMEA